MVSRLLYSANEMLVLRLIALSSRRLTRRRRLMREWLLGGWVDAGAQTKITSLSLSPAARLCRPPPSQPVSHPIPTSCLLSPFIPRQMIGPD